MILSIQIDTTNRGKREGIKKSYMKITAMKLM